jgi:hypothetical protein
MADEPRPVKHKGGGGFRGFLTSLLILALLGVVGFLLSERNHHHYFLSEENGILGVERGFLLPYGHGSFRPSDPQLARAYAPVMLPSSVTLAGEETFEDRGDLDRRMGELLLAAAASRLEGKDSRHLAEGMALLDQLDLLQQLSADQRRESRRLRGQVSFFEAQDLISRALAALNEASAMLQLGSIGAGPNAKDSADLLDRLQAPMGQLFRAARSGNIMPSDRSDLPPPPAPDGGASAAPPKPQPAP